MTIGHTIIFKDEEGEDYPAAMLTCNARGLIEIAGRFSADMYKTDVGFALRQYQNTSMKFMKYDDTTSMLTLNSLDDTATFLGNVVAPNISSLENKTQAFIYEEENNKTIIANTTETGNLKVTYATETYTLSVGSHADFSGSVFFSTTINGYNIETELSKLEYLSTMDDITEVSGLFRASNLVGITYDDNLNTTFFSGNLSSPNIVTLEDKTQNILRVPGTDEDPTSHTEIDGVSFQTTLGRISNIEGTLTKVRYDPLEELTTISGKLVTGTLNGNKIGVPESFIYNNYSPFIPVCDASGAIELGSSLDFHDLTTEQDYRCRLSCVGSNTLEIFGIGSIRATRIDTSAGMALRSGNTLMKFQKSDGTTNMLTLNATTNEATFLGNVVVSTLNGNKIGASNEGFGYIADSPAGTPSNTTIAWNLTMTGVINGTLAGSQTITHKTKITGTIAPGCFVESTENHLRWVLPASGMNPLRRVRKDITLIHRPYQHSHHMRTVFP